ncbi:MAG: glycosyltransferase family 4 protein, partial [Chloroflexi bacterium]|nr:glycosyltransferase family 4 protein [Chloroflexota bacterium]
FKASGFCRWFPTDLSTTHVFYCLTPPRYLWDTRRYLAAERDFPSTLDPLVRLGLDGLRRLDRFMADRTDHFIAISQAVADRIRDCYGRGSAVIHPPVRVEDFAPAPPTEIGDHLLLVSRLAPYKRIDLAIRACNRLRMPLRIVGSGRAEADLKAIAGPTIQFAGRIGEQRLRHELSRCRAVLFPGEEDFGLVPIEAQASGRPVLAFAGGGALETITAGETGEFFEQPTTGALIAALQEFDAGSYDPAVLVENAQGYSHRRFAKQFTQFIDEVADRARARGPS